MVRTLDDYVQLAVERQKLPSRNRLNLLLQTSHAVVSTWATGRAWPSDAIMCKLADLAGIPRDEALLDLAVWRSKDETARNTWETLRSKLSSAAAILLAVALLGTWGPRDAAASGLHAATTLIYYGNFRRWLRRTFPCTATV